MKQRIIGMRLLMLATAFIGASLSGAVVAGEPFLRGYADYDAYRLQIESIAASPFVALKSLGTTLGDREVYVLEIGVGDRNRKPAILLVSGVDPRHLIGSELAVRLARRLADEAKADPTVRKILDRVTVYVIPRAAPDACEAFFQKPYAERITNQRPTDDDKDGRLDEDAPEDLNGDGLITVLRVEDASGPYIPHKDDDRVLIEADAKKNELGRYQLYTEGRDNDDDEQINEDSPGGVAFNRNFTFRYPYFESGAGPHQVSEIETRAVADFAFDHPNIAAVLVCTPEDNLMTPWKPTDSGQSDRIKTSLLDADAPYVNRVAELYRKIHGGEISEEPLRGNGSFSEWAYFHYGRWSFAFRGWWIPQVDSSKPHDATNEDPDAHEGDTEKSDRKKRGSDDLNALRWFARENVDGFVDWKPIKHPDFPGRKVEVGGFKPFLRLNPPQSEFEPLADKHWKFVRQLAGMLPRLAIPSVKAEPLGGHVWRVTAIVVNQGDLPTMSQMGHIVRQPYPLQIELELPAGVSLVNGPARTQLPILAGAGGRAETTWLISVAADKRVSLRVHTWSPSVGSVVKRVRIAEKRLETQE